MGQSRLAFQPVLKTPHCLHLRPGRPANDDLLFAQHWAISARLRVQEINATVIDPNGGLAGCHGPLP